MRAFCSLPGSGAAIRLIARLTVRMAALALLSLQLTTAVAEIKPETIGKTTMGAPGPTWVMAKNVFGPAYIFDVATGDMQGLLSVSEWTPAIEANVRAREFYVPETYYSRRHRGERSDFVTIYDMKSLTARHEIPVPNKIAALPFRQYVGLLNDKRHLAVFNMTPAQSVSIVDVKKRTFVGEISTAGCALVMPVDKRAFLMICGDGTLQLVRLDRAGKELARIRSKTFFDVDTDPVYDKPVRTDDGWLLVSFEGKVFTATADGDDIFISEPWSITSAKDREETWRIGGGQIIDYHPGLDLLFTLMHKGKKDTHEDPGTEVWILSGAGKRRIGRIELPGKSVDLLVSRNDKPLLTVADNDNKLHVYDVATTRLERTIEGVGGPNMIIGFGND